MSFLYVFPGSISSNSVSRNCNELFDGWTVENGACIFRDDLNRCQNPFNFQSIAECQRALTGNNFKKNANLVKKVNIAPF